MICMDNQYWKNLEKQLYRLIRLVVKLGRTWIVKHSQSHPQTRFLSCHVNDWLLCLLQGSTIDRAASDKEKSKELPTYKDVDLINDDVKISIGELAKEEFLETLQADVDVSGNKASLSKCLCAYAKILVHFFWYILLFENGLSNGTQLQNKIVHCSQFWFHQKRNIGKSSSWNFYMSPLSYPTNKCCWQALLGLHNERKIMMYLILTNVYAPLRKCLFKL